MSASTVIPDRLTFGMVISSSLAYRIVRHLRRLQILMQIEFGNFAEGDQRKHPQHDETQASCQLPYRTKQNYRHPTYLKQYEGTKVESKVESIGIERRLVDDRISPW